MFFSVLFQEYILFGIWLTQELTLKQNKQKQKMHCVMLDLGKLATLTVQLRVIRNSEFSSNCGQSESWDREMLKNARVDCMSPGADIELKS